MSDRYKKWAATMWVTRLSDDKPYQGVEVLADGKIRVSLWPGKHADGLSFILSRGDARLVARRIDSALKTTGKSK